MQKAMKAMYDKAGPRVVKALEARHFDACYCSTAQEAAARVLELIPAGALVSWGGSMTVDALGVKDELRRRGQPMLDRETVNTREEREAIMRQALSCDVYLMGSNAVTEDGQLFNIDGNGNRVAALCFGPRRVIVVAGMNKVVPDLAAAYARVRHLAAPANAQRFEIATPCAVNGQCGDCKSPQSICASMVATRLCRPDGRISVVLVGEDLGF